MLKNTSIKTKILGAILLLALVACAGLVHVGNQFKKTDDAYSAFIANDAMAALLSSRASAGTMLATLQVAGAELLAPDSAEFKAAKKTFEQFMDISSKRLAEMGQLAPAQKAAGDDLIRRLAELKDIGSKAFSLYEANNRPEAQKNVLQAQSRLNEMVPLFVGSNDKMTKSLIQGSDDLTAQTISTITWSTAFILLGIVLAIGSSLVMAQAGITGPLDRLRQRMVTLANGNTDATIEGLDRHDEVGHMAASVAVFRTNAIERARLEGQSAADRNMSEKERAEREAERASQAADLQRAVKALGTGLGNLANGDLASRIETPFVAELESLRQDFNHSVEKLNDAMQAVGANAGAIAAGSNQIRSSADDLSRRTEQQAASVEETAAALEEITTTVKDASKRASEASELVARTRAGAEKSGEIVRDAINAMNLIEKSSSEIGNIIGVIDEIAFQTNLLALNAGVEAARAGEAGKGFAVVAQEVRELAQRSAKAAKEIKELIHASGSHVQTGVNLVADAGKTLDVIVSEVQEINRHVHAIAEASREQSIGLQEINTAVNAMDQGTQQNAAMVEETTAASHSLASEATALAGLLSQFRLGGGARQTTHQASRPQVNVASAKSRPVASPARKLGQNLARSFNGSAAVKVEPEWSEF